MRETIKTTFTQLVVDVKNIKQLPESVMNIKKEWSQIINGCL